MPKAELPYTRNYRFKIGFAFLILFFAKLYKSNFRPELTDVYIGSIAIILLAKEIGFLININKKKRSYPKHLKLSLLLSRHITWSLMLDGIFNFLSAWVLSTEFYNKKQYVLFFVLFIIMIPVNRFLLANNTLRLMKQIAGYKFNILIFRKFSGDYSHVIKRYLAPSLGAYGNIISIWDENLERVKGGVNSDSEDVLGESSQSIYAEDKEWKEVVSDKISTSDCFVFYWPQPPGENMLWEYHTCLANVKEDQRFLFLVHDNNANEIRFLIDSIKPGNQHYFIECNSNDLLKDHHEIKLLGLFRKSIHRYMVFLRPVLLYISGKGPSGKTLQV
jgi:hypothetical protein